MGNDPTLLLSLSGPGSALPLFSAILRLRSDISLSNRISGWASSKVLTYLIIIRRYSFCYLFSLHCIINIKHMRQWHVDPRILCRQHLLGEHNEHHLMVSSIQRKHSFAGYIRNNCIEPESLKARHNALVFEMEKRGYNHKSPLPAHDISYMPAEHRNYKVQVVSSLVDLIHRCPECRKHYDELQNSKQRTY